MVIENIIKMLKNKWLIKALNSKYKRNYVFPYFSTLKFSFLNPYPLRMCSKYYRKITPDVMKKLYWLENHYEQDPTNQKVAYKYFRELNRHGKHQTVVRLFNRYFDDYDRRIKGSGNLREKIKDQFQYAEDTIYSVKRAVEENDEEVILQ